MEFETKKVLKGSNITDVPRRKSEAVIWAVNCIFLAALAFPSSAEAQEKPTPTDGLNLNLTDNRVGFNGLNLDFENSDFISGQLNLPAESVGSTLFKLDLSNTNCLTGGENCLRRSDNLDIGYEKAFSSVSTEGLDLSLTPRATLRFNDESSSAIVGAVVEIGEDLRKGSNFENNTWYFFAGADAEALTYSPNSVSRLTSGQFHLQDRIIVGDAQAGLGYRIGNADLSLSYLRREASGEDFSFNEDAAALSFTWKR